jgi:hypothetical protein
MSATDIIKSGINASFLMSKYSKDEQKIIRNLSKELYITNAGDEIRLGSSKYRFFLTRPTTNYVELFNLKREIVVLFSDFENFEPRNLDPFQNAVSQYQELRIDSICFIIISRDIKIEDKINNLLKNDTDKPIVIPFSYNDLLNTINENYVANKFRKYLYERDLFNFESPLRNDMYFFGRSEIVHKIIGRHENNENSGLFGLRKTGKTSIIYKIQRLVEKKNMLSTYIDCQTPAVYMQRWNMLLCRIIESLNSKAVIKINTEAYENLSTASQIFEEDIDKIFRKNRSKKILIIFDELEHIFPTTSAGTHWKNDLDFIHFWRTLRSTFQSKKNIFSYLIVSTNPNCIEQEKLHGYDNPLFMQIPFEYVPPFARDDVDTMLSNLGGVMGIKFSEQVCSSITEDYGGHPFLIRLVASQICKYTRGRRPITIDPIIYRKAKDDFSKISDNYFYMMLDVLELHYNEEYEMLKYLANDDIEDFNNMANEYPMLTEHLTEYRIIAKNNRNFYFLIEEIKEYILRLNKFSKKNLSTEQKWAEISQRRNEIETRLRMIIRQTLLSHKGVDARELVLKKIPEQKKYATLGYDDLFDSRKCNIYFKTLEDIIIANWDCFKHIFGTDNTKFQTTMSLINEFRSDSHAKDISNEEFFLLRMKFKKLEESCAAFLGDTIGKGSSH